MGSTQTLSGRVASRTRCGSKLRVLTSFSVCSLLPRSRTSCSGALPIHCRSDLPFCWCRRADFRADS
ncbi:hypothetical protein PF005_g21127 [Phytophthora fragariae]|uniref:Uncharacterized protein n=1 Tax=Phytophthora fragariae TaxID=53985 RepID=A0A6A3UNX0_9STRA|nr:hypothetical protein PF003_g28202 [Phytophthora fragariae]KAE8929178.1 hypothetical protein PF009_g20700 [Phytophthora fragariae]KAE9007619.1 hypothetical protein PF011_g11055 [Phytophthora fragariae]KAE9088760.1 hypothetical protein PF007_g19851 [Phytophthora fragariae]KAE9152439.1 hypothetical protein PF006_g3356 [Phytophthora fragariae]